MYWGKRMKCPTLKHLRKYKFNFTEQLYHENGKTIAGTTNLTENEADLNYYGNGMTN